MKQTLFLSETLFSRNNKKSNKEELSLPDRSLLRYLNKRSQQQWVSIRIFTASKILTCYHHQRTRDSQEKGTNRHSRNDLLLQGNYKKKEKKKTFCNLLRARKTKWTKHGRCRKEWNKQWSQYHASWNAEVVHSFYMNLMLL